MRCPTLKELPSPPAGKTGWPWTVQTEPLPMRMWDGSEWPRISIVTPNYNYGYFLEETIRTVLLQGYPNLEYIVIDGGSTDNSIDIIKKYEPWLAYWASEKDRGQAHAINKGLEKATGSIAAYLNSDDLYLVGALQHIAQAYLKTKFDILVGRRQLFEKPKYFIFRRNWWLSQVKPFVFPFIFGNKRYELPQECVFWNWDKYRHLRLNEKYNFCLDVWWFIQLFSGATVIHTSKELGTFRIHSESKSSQLYDLCQKEIQEIISEFEFLMTRIDEKMRNKIIYSYYQATLSALIFKTLKQDFFFQYQHPEYFY